jgi:hypothetical protein
MKLFMIVAMALVGTLFTATTTPAQESHIVTYEGTPGASSKRPDFTNALIAIDFTGPAADSATTMFRRLGAKRFNVGENPCIAPETVICVRLIKGNPMQSTSYGTSSAYGTRGGFSTNGSFSGQLYPITLRVSIVDYNDGSTRPTIPLGEATCLAPAGSGSEWSSSYGRNGGGSYQSSSSGNLDSTIGIAVAHDLDALLLKGSLKNSLRKFLAWGTSAQWIPGANDTVRKYFAQ